MLDRLKDHLKITWNDEDSNLERILNSSRVYLEEDIAGIKLDFIPGSTNEDLLFNCCRYKYHNAFEYFEKNFKQELLRLQFKSVVKKNVSKE